MYNLTKAIHKQFFLVHGMTYTCTFTPGKVRFKNHSLNGN